MAAFRAAIAAGYGIECDIQRAMDDTPMVFHDYELARLTDIENGTVAASTPAQLARLHLLETQETIPTLREMLDAVAGRVDAKVLTASSCSRAGASTGTSCSKGGWFTPRP